MMHDDHARDTYNLARFLNAQDSTYQQARAELAAGQKQTHWMWFIFPQLRGLGSSSMAQRFAIASLNEAIAYLEHPVLGARLRECTTLATSAASRTSVSSVFGYPDDLKFFSSVTLFARAARGFGDHSAVFAQALGQLFGGAQDQATLALLDQPHSTAR